MTSGMRSTTDEGCLAPGDTAPAPPLTASEAALRLKCTPQLLYNLKYYGVGPRVQKLRGGSLAYDPEELDAWAATIEGPLHAAFNWQELERRRRSRSRRKGAR